MKQLYLIGILVAVVLLALFGLSKLSDRRAVDPTPEPAAEIEESDTAFAEVSADAPPLPEQAPETMPTFADVGGVETVVIKTNRGDITLELFTELMPVTTQNFLKLAREDFYDGIKFHRVIDGFMIQGGDPLTKDEAAKGRWGTGGPGYTIADEFADGLSNVRGTIAMANAGPNTGGSQFFVSTVDNTFLDSKHPVFGRVTDGMDIVDAISKTETLPGDVPVEAVVIEDVVVE